MESSGYHIINGKKYIRVLDSDGKYSFVQIKESGSQDSSEDDEQEEEQEEIMPPYQGSLIKKVARTTYGIPIVK